VKTLDKECQYRLFPTSEGGKEKNASIELSTFRRGTNRILTEYIHVGGGGNGKLPIRFIDLIRRESFYKAQRERGGGCHAILLEGGTGWRNSGGYEVRPRQKESTNFGYRNKSGDLASEKKTLKGILFASISHEGQEENQNSIQDITGL